jgi:UDP-glucose 4-epimerase
MSEGLLNLLEASSRHQIQKFVYVSSSMVYGNFIDDGTDGIKESHPTNPIGQYGIMKLAGEWLVRDYTRCGSFDHVIIRPSAVYGPRDVEDRVISRFMLSAMRGQTLKVNGPNETLDFTYVDDVADGIVAAALQPQANNKTFNITRGRSHTLLDAANLAVRIVGRGSVEIHDRDPNFPSRGALNITAARRDLGFDPQVDIEEGFKRYHEWLANSVYWSKKTV